MAESQTPAESAPESSAPVPADSGSLADHEAAYASPDRARAESQTPPAETAEADAPATTETPDVDGERDPKTGRYLPRRHRAASQEATPADVPRIRELTARLRATEAERDELRARTGRPQGAPEVSTTPPAPVPPPSKPKPTPDQYSDWTDYNSALIDWNVEQALTAYQAKQQQAEQARIQAAERDRLITSWDQRKAAAKEKYPDFQAVALDADTRIPAGSLIDAWILEHKAGADVLYALQKDPAELDRLLNLPLFDQAEALALLSQRFNGHPPRTAAAATGSAPAPVVPSVPRPPNPVRTGPIQSGDEPPDETHSSLYDHEKYYWQRNGARR